MLLSPIDHGIFSFCRVSTSAYHEFSINNTKCYRCFISPMLRVTFDTKDVHPYLGIETCCSNILSQGSAVGISHFKPVVTNDQTRQLEFSKDHIRMRFSSSLIRINFKDEITTFNPYITINSNHNYMFEYTSL